MTEKVIDPRHFRDVLGHAPTSVAAITAIDDAREPVGMIVGTFTSVSLNPPLVAFLPDRSSSTFPKIRDASSFCINILSAEQEDICRVMGAKGADRFANISWSPAPSGAPIIDGIVAWIDCLPEALHEAGDHYIFIGRVTDMEVVNPTFPLIFFQGGYGAFASGSVVIGAREGLADQIRLADLARDEMEHLADAVGAESRLIAVAGDRQMVVASAGGEGRIPASLVGVSMPMVPPFGQIFKAWESAKTVDEWINSSPTPVDEERRAAYLDELETIRRDGWMVRLADDHARETADALAAMATLGQTPRLEREIVNLGARSHRRIDASQLTDDAAAANVKFMFAPIFGPGGHVAAGLMLVHLPDDANLEMILDAKDRLLASASAITRRLGGAPPVNE